MCTVDINGYINSLLKQFNICQVIVMGQGTLMFVSFYCMDSFVAN